MRAADTSTHHTHRNVERLSDHTGRVTRKRHNVAQEARPNAAQTERDSADWRRYQSAMRGTDKRIQNTNQRIHPPLARSHEDEVEPAHGQLGHHKRNDVARVRKIRPASRSFKQTIKGISF